HRLRIWGRKNFFQKIPACLLVCTQATEFCCSHKQKNILTFNLSKYLNFFLDPDVFMYVKKGNASLNLELQSLRLKLKTIH
ncbi:hypothetical protein MKW98_031093, partial [Papaver atlanticum]